MLASDTVVVYKLKNLSAGLIQGPLPRKVKSKFDHHLPFVIMGPVLTAPAISNYQLTLSVCSLPGKFYPTGKSGEA